MHNSNLVYSLLRVCCLFHRFAISARFKRWGHTRACNFARAHQGELCLIGNRLSAEVVAVKGDEALLSPFDVTAGLCSGELVETLGHGHQVPLGQGLLGRVVDGLGAPMDGYGLTATSLRPNQGSAPNPLSRQLIDTVMPMGIRAIDSASPVASAKGLVFLPQQEGERVPYLA